jgi:hypothetical protein
MAVDQFVQLVREQGIGLALAIVIVLAWLRGWVISAATHKVIVGMLDEEIDRLEKDRDYWRAAWETTTSLTVQTQDSLQETQAVAREVVRRTVPRRVRGGET